MPYTQITPQVPTRAGLSVTFAAVDAANGNSFSNNGRRILRFKNGSGSAVTATVKFGKTIDGVDVDAGKEITIPATTGDVTTSVWTPDDYNQPDGTVHIDFSAGTSVTMAVIEV